MAGDIEPAIQAWLASQDAVAARLIMEQIHPVILRIVRRHLPFRMDEEDLAQEVLVKLFNNLHRHDPKQPFEHWVSRLAINVCRDHLRARKRRPELRWSDLTESEQLAFENSLRAEEASTPELANDARAVLHKVLETMTAEDRIVLTLLHLEERSVEQIATLTGWSHAVVRVRAFRARHRLKKAMAGLSAEFR